MKGFPLENPFWALHICTWIGKNLYLSKYCVSFTELDLFSFFTSLSSSQGFVYELHSNLRPSCTIRNLNQWETMMGTHYLPKCSISRMSALTSTTKLHCKSSTTHFTSLPPMASNIKLEDNAWSTYVYMYEVTKYVITMLEERNIKTFINLHSCIFVQVIYFIITRLWATDFWIFNTANWKD